MRQVLVELPDPLPQALAVDPQLRHRLSRVLRMAAGTEVVLGDGHGRRAAAVFAGNCFDRVVAAPVAPAEPVALTLACAVLKGERFDWLVEKAAELGVAHLQPLQTEHAVARVLGPGAADKQRRWQAVATEAFEQCGRPWCTQVRMPMAFSQWLAQRDRAVPLAACDERLPPDWLGDWAARLPACQGPRRIELVIGPEGGLSEAERLALDCAGAERVWISHSVLRAETAALAAAVIALAPFAAKISAPLD